MCIKNAHKWTSEREPALAEPAPNAHSSTQAGGALDRLCSQRSDDLFLFGTFSCVHNLCTTFFSNTQRSATSHRGLPSAIQAAGFRSADNRARGTAIQMHFCFLREEERKPASGFILAIRWFGEDRSPSTRQCAHRIAANMNGIINKKLHTKRKSVQKASRLDVCQ